MAKKPSKDVGGRPTIYSDELVTKLEGIFKVGGTIDEATSYAGISRQTYYRWLEDKEGFVTKMEAAQHYSDIVAKNLVIDDIVKNKDVGSAKWWLEKRQFKDNNTTNVQVNVKPLLGGEAKNYVPNNDSNEEDTQT